LNAERRTDNSGARHRRLDQVVLEIVVEKFGRAHREETNILVNFPFAELPEFLGEEKQFHDVPRPKRGRVRWRAHQSLADELCITSQVCLEAEHGIGIVRRMSLQLEIRCFCVVIRDESLIAIGEIDRTQIGHDQQTVFGKVEIAVYRLPHHAADIRVTRVLPALVKFLGAGCATDIVVFFQQDDFESGLREISSVGQAVVTCADNNSVIFLHRRISRAALCPAAPVMSPPG
jgi:hypothetical protein